MIDNQVTALVVRFYERLWNRWDDSAVDHTLAEGFTFRGSLGVQTTGREGWRAYRDLTRWYAPDFRNHIVSVVADTDRAAVRLLFTGTHLGPILGFAATGRPRRSPQPSRRRSAITPSTCPSDDIRICRGYAVVGYFPLRRASSARRAVCGPAPPRHSQRDGRPR